MRRPRLPLTLPNPRRRLRDRLLAAMLIVALVPAAAFFVLAWANLRGITQTTVNGAVTSTVNYKEATLQTSVNATSAAIDSDLSALRGRIVQLAQEVGSLRLSATTAALGPETCGVTPVNTGPAPQPELLAGTPPQGNSSPVSTRAGPLTGLSQFAYHQLASAAAKEGDFVDAAWVMDLKDNTVWLSPPPTLPQTCAGLAANPQGAPVDLLSALGSPAPSPPPPTSQASPSWQWTAPYLNPLHGDWEVTVYATAGNGLLVGADVPLAQFATRIAQGPVQAGAYPLLLGSGGRVIASGDTGKDFAAPLQVGHPLPTPAGEGAAALLSKLDHPDSAGNPQGRIEATIGRTPTSKGTDKLFFTAAVSDPGWTLVEAAQKSSFLPDVTALQTGINSALTNIFGGAVPIVAALVVVCFLLATGLSRFIVAPVRALTASAERLAGGHTDEPVPPQGRDEVGDLAASLERMRRELNASREVILAASRELEHKITVRTAELSARNEELLALNELAGSLTRSLDPGAILAGALEAVRAVLPMTASCSYLLGRDGRLTTSGVPTEDGRTLLEQVAVAAIAENRVVIRSDPDGVLIGLPMATSGGPLGALGLRTAAPPGPEMTALLMAIGNQVGLALSTARLSEEGREMAVLEERARLAREIHDTLAQQLTGIVIQLEAAQALVSRQPERSLPALASAQELARSALAEARRSVWDLRPAPLTATGLVAAAEQEVERFRRRTGVAARLRAERMAPPPGLKPQSEVALLRITQQALANIAAHSGAGRVNVRLRNLGDQVELTVKDNGHGFDTSALPAGSFGIVGMAERARLAGGSFQVESIPGRGTTIIVLLPVTAEAVAKSGTPPRAAVPV